MQFGCHEGQRNCHRVGYTAGLNDDILQRLWALHQLHDCIEEVVANRTADTSVGKFDAGFPSNAGNQLGVNIDHVATVRQARRGIEPEPVVEVEPAPQQKSPETEDKKPAEESTGVTKTGTGQQMMPEKPAVVVPEKPWTPSPLTLWVVHKGEHLWGISAHRLVYGDAYQWPLLFKRNRHQIKDADLIYPGQVLIIERNLSTAEIDRAIEHAKTRGAWILGITELSDLEYLSRERSYQ